MKAIALIFLLSSSMTAFSSDCCQRADAFAPIGVMGDHSHGEGNFMLSLRHMSMTMENLIDGSSYKSGSDYRSDTNYMMTPEKMPMSMYMLGLMYGLPDGYTLMVMQDYVSNDMTSRRNMNGEKVDSSSEGLGDTKVSVIKDFSPGHDYTLVGQLGVSLPTGDINQSKNGSNLGYPMQLGSGSYGAILAVTGSKAFGAYTLGAQAKNTSYLNRNSNDYTLGDRRDFSAWATYSPLQHASFSLRLQRIEHEKISGEDEEMSSMMSPQANEAYSERRFDFAHLGASYLFRQGSLSGHRLAVEYGKLVGYDVSDYQLAPDNILTLGWQKAF